MKGWFWPATLWIVVLVLSALSAEGCAPVMAWQRGALAHRCMQWAPDGDFMALREHVFTVREAAQGGHGSAGGGCGCD